jgi:hypothetical protein
MVRSDSCKLCDAPIWGRGIRAFWSRVGSHFMVAHALIPDAIKLAAIDRTRPYLLVDFLQRSEPLSRRFAGGVS